MQTDTSERLPEIAIFLGAGASCSEGAPAQSQLFKNFFEEAFGGYRGIALGDPALLPVQTLKNSLVRFFQQFFGFDPLESHATAQFPTFEEALAIVDLALARDESFRGFEGNLFDHQHGATLRKLRGEFVFLIALILDKKLERSHGHHRSLVRNLREKAMLDRCTFVSFNYDIVIDNALEELTEHALDYGIGCVSVNEQDALQRRRVQPISLLKLHGSLNWLYCSSCRSLVITRGEKGVANLVVRPHDCHCQKCGSLMVPIVIPPTYFKILSNLFLQEVWHHAEMLLSSCRTWVFCGYSFPDADMHVKYLLKRVQVNSAGPRKVIVLNWHSEKKEDEAKQEMQRFQRFFGTAAELINLRETLV